MNSRWQIYRVGLVDFWYYDDEEFYFADGRLLLRGANGSGKSVTMQSFIPLLLDGNMRPERLDPFGSRARKMENYLLEDGDGREERTGYLYMEFKRQDSDVYMTLGMGLRARRNKKLESWYFCLTDGRRMGKDFWLYKEMSGKVALSKQELRNRIGSGGRVMDTQGEYADCVNRLLFGFETIDAYKELLELLIQLRTPKLSKDFKPTVINEILSSSLQTLSEDDLRPMSEAIENMDSLKVNLDALTESVAAAKQIEKVYDQYNKTVLVNKAQALLKSQDALELLSENVQILEKQIKESRAAADEAQKRYEQLRQEEDILKKERDSLSSSDAAKLKTEELKISRDLSEQRNLSDNKQKQCDEKEEKRRETAAGIKKQEETNALIWETVGDDLEMMAETLEDVPFDDFEFMRKELEDGKNKTYSFEAHSRLLKEYTKNTEEAQRLLTEEHQRQSAYEQMLKALDISYEERNRNQKAVSANENLLHEIKEELKENIYRWSDQNERLRPKDEVLQEISRKIDAYEMGNDYSEIRDLAKTSFYEAREKLLRDSNDCERELNDAKKALESAKEELLHWQMQKDPMPDCLPETAKNRQKLAELNIPYMQFYKAVDFVPELDGAAASKLEEALWRMGVLDALIISDEYRDQVLALDGGVCDRYIFTDVETVKQNLNQALDVDNGENDILLYQRISHILSAIGWQSTDAGAAAVDDDGHYKIGIIEGNITKNYEAKFIGAAAREKYRRQKIDEISCQCSELASDVQQWEKKLGDIRKEAAALLEVWQQFPEDGDLKVAAGEYARAVYRLDLTEDKIRQQRAQTDEAAKLLEDIRKEAAKACGKCYLPHRMDTVCQTAAALIQYREQLTKLQLHYGKYANGLEYIKIRQEYLEELDSDLDDIRYELGTMRRRVEEISANLEAVRRQLTMTDYEQIRQRLDQCVEKLAKIPAEREAAVRANADYSKKAEYLHEKCDQAKAAANRETVRYEWLVKVFEAECRLAYVCPENSTDQPLKMALEVCRTLESRAGLRRQNDLFGSLQEIFHLNKGSLAEYKMTIQTLFDDYDETMPPETPAAKRLDITAKYRGRTVNFKELIIGLAEDAQAMARLLSDKDRELFEDILANTISKKIRGRIHASRRWVDHMNELMSSMQTSSGLRLSLKWKNRRAESEEQMDTAALVELLSKDRDIMRRDEIDKLSAHFRSKIQEARRQAGEGSGVQSFHSIMREVLDYRKWFEFQLECQKTGEKKKELTDRVFFTLSGGEKAMAMYVPLFSAVAAKYDGARDDAPRLISLDEAFAGVDDTNIRDMFRLMVEFGFNFMINSQILWGDYDTVPQLAIDQLVRPENARYVTVIHYFWNGKTKQLTA